MKRWKYRHRPKFINARFTDLDQYAAFPSFEKPNTHFNVDIEVVLVRVLSLDGACKQVVEPLCPPYFPPLYHSSLPADHSGERRMYHFIRKEQHCPQVANDVYSRVHDCRSCEQNCASDRKQRQLKPVLSGGPCSTYSKDLGGPALKLNRVTDLLSLWLMDTQSWWMPYRHKKGTAKAFIFSLHWVASFGNLAKILTANSSKPVSQLFMAVCSRYDMSSITTTQYQPQTSGQAERIKSTI